jgi:nucleotide-binding universal stress UspA family protein
MLVCIDSPVRASPVLAAAVELAAQANARVFLFHAILGAGEKPVPSSVLVERGSRDLETLGHASVPPELLGGVRAVTALDAWKAICNEAAAREADLIVIGAREHGALTRALGTIAANVVNHAPCTVLVVKRPRGSTSPA